MMFKNASEGTHSKNAFNIPSHAWFQAIREKKGQIGIILFTILGSSSAISGILVLIQAPLQKFINILLMCQDMKVHLVRRLYH